MRIVTLPAVPVPMCMGTQEVRIPRSSVAVAVRPAPPDNEDEEEGDDLPSVLLHRTPTNAQTVVVEDEDSQLLISPGPATKKPRMEPEGGSGKRPAPSGSEKQSVPPLVPLRAIGSVLTKDEQEDHVFLQAPRLIANEVVAVVRSDKSPPPPFSLFLSQLPPEMQSLSKLRTLSLSNNLLAALPAFLGEYSALKTLDLDHNLLKDLPAEMGKLIKLEVISLQKNLLPSVPPCMLEMKGLKNINLSENRLTEVPLALCELPKLDVLDLSGNQIKELPANCSELTVAELNLDRNQLAFVPSSLARAKKLRVLRLNENCISKEGIPVPLLRDSQVCLITFEGNPLQSKEFQDLEGHDAYSARYTLAKKKMG